MLTCSGRRTSAAVAVSFGRPPTRHDQAVVPRMKKPVTMATSRWNHSTKSGSVRGNTPPLQSGHCASQASPEPVAAV